MKRSLRVLIQSIVNFFSGSPWGPYVYTYAVGGAFFFTGLCIAWKRKVLVLERSSSKETSIFHPHRKLLAILLGGYFFYALSHGIWIYCVLK